jgi:hypothetical protein
LTSVQSGKEQIEQFFIVRTHMPKRGFSPENGSSRRGPVDRTSLQHQLRKAYEPGTYSQRTDQSLGQDVRDESARRQQADNMYTSAMLRQLSGELLLKDEPEEDQSDYEYTEEDDTRNTQFHLNKRDYHGRTPLHERVTDVELSHRGKILYIEIINMLASFTGWKIDVIRQKFYPKGVFLQEKIFTYLRCMQTLKAKYGEADAPASSVDKHGYIIDRTQRKLVKLKQGLELENEYGECEDMLRRYARLFA